MRLRSPVMPDAPAVLAVIVACEIAETGTADTTLADVHDVWNGSEFDLSADARVVQLAGGRIVGYADTIRRGISVVVAHGHQGRGIGSCLRRWAEHRDRELGRERHRQWIAAGNERGHVLLLAAGYQPQRSYWRLARRLERVQAGAAPPAGIRFRTVDPDEDAAALHALDDVSFSANADYEACSFAAFRDEHLRAVGFDGELSCVAELGGQPVAFLLALRRHAQNTGFIDVLGVHPDHRRRGLGTVILQGAFARFGAAGLDEAQLVVASDNPNALRLYKRCGMIERFRHDTYERSSS